MATGEDLLGEAESDGSARGRRWPGAASTPPSPTGPGDYAILEGVFVGALTGVVALARRRGQQGVEVIGRRDLPVFALATFALADVVAKEKVSTWIREPFVREGDDHKPAEPEGTGLRRAVGELLTCTRCVGTWSALALVGLKTASPAAGATTANVLALAGANDLMQSMFRLLVERTNRASLDIDMARRAVDGG